MFQVFRIHTYYFVHYFIKSRANYDKLKHDILYTHGKGRKNN